MSTYIYTNISMRKGINNKYSIIIKSLIYQVQSRFGTKPVLLKHLTLISMHFKLYFWCKDSTMVFLAFFYLQQGPKLLILTTNSLTSHLQNLKFVHNTIKSVHKCAQKVEDHQN